MFNKEFNVLISSKNLFYEICIKIKNKTITFRDSYKILPFGIAKIAKDFNLENQKGTIEYEGERHAYSHITEEEEDYLKKDVLILRDAMEIAFQKNLKKLTIGSACMSEFKIVFKQVEFSTFDETFPNLSNFVYQNNQELTVYDFERKAYKGAFCYLKDGCSGKIYHNGITLDINSLYPFVMLSPYQYPIGEPHVFKPEDFEYVRENEDIYYFVHIKCLFILKQDMLPTIQIKNNPFYCGNKYLIDSDPTIKGVGKVKYMDVNGVKTLYKPDLYLTKTDYCLFKKHYHVFDEEVLGGVWHYTRSGLFDDYINKYKEIKESSTGVNRQIAKLMSNNLYGKFATSRDSSFKIPYLDEEGVVKYELKEEYKKKGGYIAIGSAITAYAREWTITHAQENYDNFIYSDTDSIHLACNIEDVIDCEIHETKYGAWKVEQEWDNAIFLRQKTYIEHDIHHGYNVCCAGMSDYCKNLLIWSIQGQPPEGFELKKEEHKSFLYYKDGTFHKRKLSDFKVGLEIPGQLKQKTIKGGVVLNEQPFIMRKSTWLGFG